MPPDRELDGMEVGYTVPDSRCPSATMEAPLTICFPPFSLIERTLKKIIMEKITLILTAHGKAWGGSDVLANLPYPTESYFFQNQQF